MLLTAEEKKVRKLLVRVAKGQAVSRRSGRISYKEVWEYFRPNTPWGCAHVAIVVDWITRISALEIQNNRPPLNELVTPTNKLVPSDPWDTSESGIRHHLKKLSGINVPYKSHEEAQEACWRYWINRIEIGSTTSEIFNTDTEAEEGYRQDKQASFIKRNRKIIEAAKNRDNFTCQACGFFLVVERRPMIDCHHKVPLGDLIEVRVTRISDLVCLCPTCHRIAHTRPYPLSVRNIRECLDLR